MNDRTPQHPDEDRGWPRWLKILLIITALVALVVVAVMLLGGGGHNRGRHISSHPDGATAAISLLRLEA